MNLFYVTYLEGRNFLLIQGGWTRTYDREGEECWIHAEPAQGSMEQIRKEGGTIDREPISSKMMEDWEVDHFDETQSHSDIWESGR